MSGLVTVQTGQRDMHGLYVGAAVVVMGINGYDNAVGLVTWIHPENHQMTDRHGTLHEWTGKRPIIDVVIVTVVPIDLDEPEGPKTVEQVQINGLAHHHDVISSLALEGKPSQMVAICPRYACLRNMEGY